MTTPPTGLPAAATSAPDAPTALPPATPARPARMRAVVQDRYGSADVLRLDRIEPPAIGPAEVLIRVGAAGLDRGTWHLLTGRPYLMRVMGFGLRAPKDRVPGRDVAGTVVAVGSAVTRFAVGDEVYGVARGSFAEFAAAPEDKLAHRPAALSAREAAAVPISASTALQAVQAGGVQAGQRVLVTGASGGVGSYAVQIATARGARVTGVCSPAKADLVRSLGAAEVIDYTREDFAGPGRVFDVILDIGGHPALRRLRRALTPEGTAVIVGQETGGRWLGGFDRQLRALAWSPFVRQRFTMLVSTEDHRHLLELADLIESGAVRPALHRAYALDEVPAALRDLEAGRIGGKAVIVP